LAPRLNAVGRLADANLAVKFLLSNDQDFLTNFATKVESLNGERKLLTSQVLDAARSQIESSRTLPSDPLLVLWGRDWPGGVLGLVASRLVEIYGKPSILLTVKDDGFASGSARSIEGFDINAALGECKDLLAAFGGHPMAAGLSLPEINLSELRRRLNRIFEKKMKGISASSVVEIEQYVGLNQLDLNQVLLLEKLSPFGAGNPAPVFAARNLVVEKINPIGKEGEHLKVAIHDEHQNHGNVLWWQGAGNPHPEIDDHIDLAFKARSSTYNGRLEIQLEWVDWQRPSNEAVNLKSRSKFAMIDLRASAETGFKEYLQNNLANRLILCEGADLSGISVADRNHLHPADELVIASIPPGFDEIRFAVQAVKPRRIVLWSIPVKKLQSRELLGKVLGMWKYAEGMKDFEVISSRMAAKLNTRSTLIELCLLLLNAKQIIEVPQHIKENFLVGIPLEDQSDLLSQQIEELILEIENFHDFYLRAKPEDIIG